MAVEVCHDAWTRVACLYDNTTDTAFGPIFKGIGAGTEAEDFLEWLREGNAPTWIQAMPRTDGTDPRDFNPTSLLAVIEAWREQYEPATPEPQSLRVDREPDGYRLEGGRMIPTDR